MYARENVTKVYRAVVLFLSSKQSSARQLTAQEKLPWHVVVVVIVAGGTLKIIS